MSESQALNIVCGGSICVCLVFSELYAVEPTGLFPVLDQTLSQGTVGNIPSTRWVVLANVTLCSPILLMVYIQLLLGLSCAM